MIGLEKGQGATTSKEEDLMVRSMNKAKGSKIVDPFINKEME